MGEGRGGGGCFDPGTELSKTFEVKRVRTTKDTEKLRNKPSAYETPGSIVIFAFVGS